MIYLGLRREDVDTADIHAATFHPFKDEWYVKTVDEKGKPFIATFTEDGVCSKIQIFLTPEGAMEHFQDNYKWDEI